MRLNEQLAEIIGIMLGDGSIHRNGKKSYQTVVTSGKAEADWLNYVKLLFEQCLQGKFRIIEIKYGLQLKNYSPDIGNILIKAGLMEGNKVKNKVIIPSWILRKRKYTLKAVQGIFDTDGSVYRKYGNYAQIEFKFGCIETTASVQAAVRKLGFSPTIIQKQLNKTTRLFRWRFYLSKQQEIENFLKEVQPKNPKHMLRYSKIKSGAAATFR